MSTFVLSNDQKRKAEALVDPALAFLEGQQYPLGGVIVRYVWRDGAAQDVSLALAAYQNADGGFAGLDVDIASTVSNPFAARLAMQVLALLPAADTTEIRSRLRRWLVENQHEDGDWHFAPQVYEDRLAPWFTGWPFPALNPACCIAGAAHRLGLSTPEMMDRVARLFAEKASLDEARGDEFYAVLPYAEYVGIAEVPDQDIWLQAVADGIVATDAAGSYGDAQHFFDHALASGPALASRIPVSIVGRWTDVLLSEPADDGGWPTPYDPAWRPWTTTTALVALARLRNGI